MRNVIIRPSDGRKGRSFRAVCLASISADFIQSAPDNVERPVWAVFAGSQSELRPFGANLRLGRKADTGSTYLRRRTERMEFMKSVGFAQAWQHESDGSLLTMYLPDLFRPDPGMVDPQRITFICLASKAWEASQEFPEADRIARYAAKLENAADTADATAAVEPWIALAHLFAVYLDRRTRCPIPADGRFYLQLMIACLREGMASFPTAGSSYGREKFGHHPSFGFTADTAELQQIGIGNAIAFRSDHEKFEELLSTEVERFFATTRGKP